ncbi:MAG TPA: glutamyl-tRNA reductase [Gemmatimonadaceae bacterium]|nr:glutamyl-tRNA reductase [Gemmatimonadaceae bacterium]
MQIVVTGVNHGTAPLGVRERLSIPEEHLGGALRDLHGAVGDCFVLSTCNRVELYALCGHETTGAETLRRWLGARGGLSTTQVASYGYTHGHDAAAQHAFRVASGLDSMIVGEDQILGQVRRALAIAREAGTLGPVLDRLGSSALACGKRVRTCTELGHAAPSVVSVAVEAAAAARGTLDGARILVVGSGETASLALRQLRSMASAKVTVVGRTGESAAALALAHDVAAAPWDALRVLAGDADVILGCTASARPVLTSADVRSTRRPGASLVCVDLGVPRDMEPAIGAIPGVTLIDVDRLEGAAGTLRSARHPQIAAAEELVADEVERFMTWWRDRSVAPAIARLHQHALHIREAELDRALARLAHLSERDREIVRTLAERVTSKLLHDPTIALKRDPEGANMALMLDRMFRLTPGVDTSPAHLEPLDTHQPSGDLS